MVTCHSSIASFCDSFARYSSAFSRLRKSGLGILKACDALPYSSSLMKAEAFEGTARAHTESIGTSPKVMYVLPTMLRKRATQPSYPYLFRTACQTVESGQRAMRLPQGIIPGRKCEHHRFDH